MRVNARYLAVVSLTTIAAISAVDPALAQKASPGASSDQLDDIVVTARKIAESSQSLPITVNALDSKDIARKVVLNVQDLQLVTPGLTISNNATGGSPVFAIRGTATEIGIDGGVALYFNDVPLISTVGMVNAFYDVSTVEVLKGPQGTQFGTNTTGGTITVRTNLPTKDVEGYLKAGYGNYNRRELEGVVNLPVNDVLSFRVAGNYVKRDGYVNNPVGAGAVPDRLSNENHYSLRGTMLMRSGPVESVLIVDYYNRDEAQPGYVPLAFGPSALGVNPALLGGRTGNRSTVYMGPNPSGIQTPSFGKSDLYGVQHRVNIDVSDNLTFRNVIGFRHDNNTTSEEPSGTALYIVNVYNNTKIDQWNDDVTLRYSALENRLRLSLGGYISLQDKTQGINVNAVQSLYEAFFGAPLVTAIRNYERHKINSKAVYFNGEFDITRTLGISGGVRYNWDHVSSRVSASQANGILPIVGPKFLPDAAVPCTALALAGYADKNLDLCFARRAKSFKAPSWNIVLTNKFSRDVLAYIKASHGYLAGGTNFTIREVPFFEPETTTMFEGGLKADWRLGGRPVRTNVAVYYGRTTNKQVNYNANYDDGFSAYGVFNAAKLEVYGLDLEARYSPLPHLTLDGSYNYIHAEFKDFRFPAVGGNGDGKTGATLVPAVDLSGATPAQTPKHQVNAAITYEWPVDPKSGVLSTTISGYYTSTISQTNVFAPYNASFGQKYNELKGYFLASASLNWKHVLGSPVSGQLWVRNIFDKEYITFQNAQFQAFGFSTALFGAPRTFGASATIEF